MTTEFKLPELGENVVAGDVIKILVSVGDRIEPDQPVLELETDKATVEVPSSVGGVVKQIHVKEGEKAGVGQVILTVEDQAGEVKPEPEPEEPQAEAEPRTTAAPTAQGPRPKEAEVAAAPSKTLVQFELPELGENVVAGDVVRILVSVGDKIEPDQPVLELETDKATVEVPSFLSGVVKQIHVKEGEKASVRQPILTVETTAAGQAAAQPPPPPSATEPEPAAEVEEEVQPVRPEVETGLARAVRPDPARSAVPAAPNVRRLAREIGVDITQVHGTSILGRISMDDVKHHARQLLGDGTGVTPAGRVPTKPLPDFSKWGQVEREPMSNIRRATAEHLSQAWATIPHVTNFDQADIVELEQLRQRFAKKAEEAGGKLTITAILLKVVAGTLKKFPQFKASIDMANHEIVYRKYCHIGVAVDTERGLLVPVIRDVNQKNILELAVELTEVSEKARNGKLSLEDMQGGVFTLTNLGGIGGLNFTPVINSPEVAILGVARGRVEPVYRDGQFEPRLMLPLALSYDHRLIDGADAARFLRRLAQMLEEPFMMSL